PGAAPRGRCRRRCPSRFHRLPRCLHRRGIQRGGGTERAQGHSSTWRDSKATDVPHNPLEIVRLVHTRSRSCHPRVWGQTRPHLPQTGLELAVASRRLWLAAIVVREVCVATLSHHFV